MASASSPRLSFKTLAPSTSRATADVGLQVCALPLGRALFFLLSQRSHTRPLFDTTGISGFQNSMLRAHGMDRRAQAALKLGVEFAPAVVGFQNERGALASMAGK